MHVLARVLNPCFVLRPDIFVRACWRKLRPRPARCLVKTAWGDLLEIEPRKFIGAGIYMRGVHELPVCELLWRLAETGEAAVDVGANIGVMTGLLARRVGESGRVLAFEPHPDVFRQLERNVRRWTQRRIELFNHAVSRLPGLVNVHEGVGFGGNEGTARVGALLGGGRSFEVPAVRLDDALPPGRYGVTKIDVEGYEFEVLAGAQDCLTAHRLRDVVFESTWNYPSPAHEVLLGYGYQIFEIRASFCRPRLAPSSSRSGGNGLLTDYLATTQPGRARELVAPPGWRVLRRPPVLKSAVVTFGRSDPKLTG